jgi:deazaflavin-dependent oxidoreductase (nitroreductase family)
VNKRARRWPGPVVGRLLKAPILLYRAKLGWLLGHRFMVVRHVGRRTGRRYESAVEVIGRDRATGDLFVLVGLGRSADWYRNLEADPAPVVIMIAGRALAADHRVVPVAEAAAIVAAFERRMRGIGPVVRFVLGRLLGWRYDGTPAARQRLVEQLPVVAFRAVPPSTPNGSSGPGSHG